MAFPYPFSAIVGQEDMKHALLLCAVEPALGGVLVFGDRGTGKSTSIRALAALLPPIDVRQGCRYNCRPGAPADNCSTCNAQPLPPVEQRAMPVIDLPLGATEDRVCGALDLEKALVSGEKAFEPGLLARAHRGFLYIDEVNLLEDHIVDLLLDVAASGENLVEREGLSVRHPARFVLVGSGNPEEGELRPQLLDRFGLSVDVKSPDNIADRVRVIRNRESYERDPDGFVARHADEDAAIRDRILASRERLTATTVSDEILEQVARLCMRLGIDGLRGELTLMRAARAHAAFSGRTAVTLDDIHTMAPMALSHRLRRDPLDEAGSGIRVERAVAELATQPVGHA